jgi:DNA-binding MarR family transcriptional regulator
MDKTFDHQQLDEFLHSRIRLAIMSILATVNEIDFNMLKKEVNTTDGNLSIHLKKLEEKKYVNIKKGYSGRKPLTTINVTENGISALNNYFKTLEGFIRNKK